MVVLHLGQFLILYYSTAATYSLSTTSWHSNPKNLCLLNYIIIINILLKLKLPG